jgi:membrane protease YdiL (CAAX protease family)
MAIHRDYMQAIMLLIAGLFAAVWIQINYDFEAGAIYITMMLISIFFYLIADKLGIVKGVAAPVITLFGIDRNPVFDSVLGLVIGFLFIGGMGFTSLSIGAPAPIYPLTPFAEQVNIISTLVVNSFLAPIGEEAFFGGIFLWFAWKNTKVFGLAVIIVSIGFAWYHYTSYGASLPAAYVGAFLFRVIMCLLIFQTKSILPAVIVHGMVNAHLYIESLGAAQ